ncbi:unnamed protein product [Gongylonema pulchrum]|uniref:Uncharacterized protein n=1 Tax=Gongylonema pulchrum TaxID=637853 RepID=A0A183DT29_9BILA|nr:unnamed protein product [Gongylonema pulchrum]
MPLIVYHDRLQRIITDLQHNPVCLPFSCFSYQRTVADVDVVVCCWCCRNFPDFKPQQQTETMNSPAASGAPVSTAESSSGTGIAEASGSRSPSDGDSPLSCTDANRDAGVPPGIENAPVSSHGTEFAGESEEYAAAIGGSDSVTPHDPLLLAGERTAREIVDNAISGIFNRRAVTGSSAL